jgi:hypothetical protein
MRGSLVLTALAVAGLFAACYPTAQCTSPCGVTFLGSDCRGYVAAETATVAAFGPCDAGSPDDACSNLSGWRVVLATDTHPYGDAGQRYFTQWNNEAPDGGALPYVFGETDWNTRTVTLADEHWPSGVASTELVHVATGEMQANYGAWRTDGRRCVVDTAKRAPYVLTGSEGGSP